ncbi:outer membrane protein assembly factor BamB family protein [Nonomuraea sp. ZG12]|uniref:outer membrane protein assembly factor BamB family protein n=1 Tax=Nonomuraea sp. ZG12 TaxID=3452207 RepID=UPI003F8964CD
MRLRALIAALLATLCVLAGAAGSGVAPQARPAFTVAWSAELGDLGIDGAHLSVPVATIGGRSLLALPSMRASAIQLHDAATGAVVRAFPFARPYEHTGFVGELLAVRTREGLRERITVHDPVTGRTTWSRLLPYADVATRSYLSRSVITPTGIAWAANDGLHGLDPASGRDAWTVPWPGECRDRQLFASELAVIAAHCEDGTLTLHGVDMRAGRLIWTHRVRGSRENLADAKISTTRLIVAREPGNVTVLDAYGRRVARSRITYPDVTSPTAVGDAGLTLLIRSVGGVREMTATRPRDGRVIWHASLRPRTTPGTPEGYAGDADTLTAGHAMGSMATELAPLMMEVISLRDGTRDVLPLPVGGRAGMVVAGTSRDVLVYERHPGGDRVTAYTFHDGPGASSPLAVPPDRWPDACALLDPAALPGYVPVPATVEHLRVRWPKPNVCEFVPSDDAGALVRVAVTWVAATDADAARLARTTLAADAGALRLGEGAYLRSDVGNDDRRTFAWVTGGRVLAEVQATGDSALTRRAALAVAARLRGP